MTTWKHTVKFNHFWGDDEMSIEKKGKLAAKSLEFLKRYYKDDYELEDIIEQFECVSGDGEPPETTEFTVTEDFDARMYDLYNWADCNKVWVKTSF